jgi:myotubularin-related protein 1/2
MTQFSSMLGEWLNHIQSIMVGASWIAAQIVQESASVLVHCRFFFLHQLLEML